MPTSRLLALLTSLLLALGTTAHAQGGGGAGAGAGTAGAPSTGSGAGSNFGSTTNPNSGAGSASTTGMPPGTGSGQTGGSTTSTPGGPAVIGVTPNQALTAIQAQGFTGVHDLQRVGNTYTATATQNGQMKQVQIDANTGGLIPQ